MTDRIRWINNPEAGESSGYVGTLNQAVFRIWPPDAEGDCLLFVYLAGHQGELYHGDSEAELKTEAARLLAESVASLGAVFPSSSRPSRAWHADWREDGRDLDGNLILCYEPTGALYKVLPIEEAGQ